jgi:putative membrane protein
MDWVSLQGIYCGPAPDPASLAGRWNLDPVLLAALLLLAVAVRRDARALVGVGVLAVAFVSPLCALSAALFSARVVHHVVLVAVAAPLLAVALGPARRLPLAPAFVAFTAILWIWHLPAAYDLALGNRALYWVMQGSLLGAAVLFWATVLGREQAPGVAVMATLGGYVQMALLGALLTFAPDSLYAIHATAPLAFGLSPLSDQQLGGLIMWVPAGVPFLVVGALVARRGWRALGEPA